MYPQIRVFVKSRTAEDGAEIFIYASDALGARTAAKRLVKSPDKLLD